MPWWGWLLIGIGVVGFGVLKIVSVSAFTRRMKERRGGKQILDD